MTQYESDKITAKERELASLINAQIQKIVSEFCTNNDCSASPAILYVATLEGFVPQGFQFNVISNERMRKIKEEQESKIIKPSILMSKNVN